MALVPRHPRATTRALSPARRGRWLPTAGFAVIGAGMLLELLRQLLGLHGSGWRSLSDSWVYLTVEFVVVALCVARTAATPLHRRSWALITAAITLWAIGDVLETVWLHRVFPPFPTAGNGPYLVVYPLIYAGLMLRVRSRLRDAAAAQWLDGAVMLLAVGAVAVALTSGLADVGHVGFLNRALVTAHPILEGMLFVLLLVAFALMDWRPERDLLVLGAGIVLVTAADTTFVAQVSSGKFVDGTLLNLLYLSSFCSFAVARWMPAPPGAVQEHSAPHTIVLTVAAAVAALALLILATLVHVTPVSVGLAAGALVLAAVRSALTYLENVQILRSRVQEAMHDVLTELPNRRRLLADLENPASDNASRTLAFFDLNGFKSYNDGFGHLAGDALLTRLAAALQQVVGSHGRAYRLGGDEFCVLLDGSYERDHPLVDLAVTALSEQGKGFSVSAAMGVTHIPEEADTPAAALRLSDERMYADKGRARRSQAQDVLMQLLSERTPGLYDHVGGVTRLAGAVADELHLDAEQIDETLRAAELHDVGKLAIPDEILDKPGPLDEREWSFMRQHPAIGARILGAAPALAPVAKLVRASHERWDGLGYPDGLAGEQVPLGARIVAACDAYDAIVSERIYQRARTPEEALAELRRHAGTQFDPVVVEAVERCVHRLSAATPARAVTPVDVAVAPADAVPVDAP